MATKMRVLHESTYRERMRISRKLGRKDGQRIMVRRTLALVGIAALMFGGVEVSRAATPKPIASGSGRVMVGHPALEKWFRRYIVRATKGHVKPSALHIECRKRKCIGYSADGTTDVEIVRLASGEFHLLKFLMPDYQR